MIDQYSWWHRPPACTPPIFRASQAVTYTIVKSVPHKETTMMELPPMFLSWPDPNTPSLGELDLCTNLYKVNVIAANLAQN
jgi:hypothetical protein